MFHGIRTKVFLMTNLVMIIFFWLMTVEHFLVSSGVGGISPTIRYRLAGRFHYTFIITLALWQQISFGLWMSHDFFTLMIVITDSYKFPLIRGYTLIVQLLMSVDLQLQNQPFSLWPIIWFNLDTFWGWQNLFWVLGWLSLTKDFCQIRLGRCFTLF